MSDDDFWNQACIRCGRRNDIPLSACFCSRCIWIRVIKTLVILYGSALIIGLLLRELLP